MASNNFRLGSLYPTNEDGTPNVLLSSGYSLDRDDQGYYISDNGSTNGSLKATLEITTDPVNIKNVSKYVEEWLIPQLTDKDDENSIFNQYLRSIITGPPTGGWTAYANNVLLEALSYLGYRGYGYDQAANQTGDWAKISTATGELYEAVKKKENYFPELLWNKDKKVDAIISDFDSNALLKNLASMTGSHEGEPPLWYPSMLYTYGVKDKGTSYPGPVLMIKPGETLELEFDNNIAIPGLTEKQAQMASLVENNSYGLNGGAMAGGMDSTNFHMHGGHVSPTGFADNVVSRYTTGQDWTTIIDIPKDHGRGSYWYHPHYHPAVNTQVYGGLSGFMQVGDPLKNIPSLENIPRNLGVIKTMQVGIDEDSGDYKLASINGNILGTQSLATNRASMFTINGEYQPEINKKSGGWQSFTFSNQDNNYYMNLAIRHEQPDGSWKELPLYIYGEDGHQYPQIRHANKSVLGYQQVGDNAESYEQASNLISLPSGKRMDLLVNLPAGKSELITAYSFKGKNDETFDLNSLRWQQSQYAELSSENKDTSVPNSGPGAIATFIVDGDAPNLSTKKLNKMVKRINDQINVQKITPLTSVEEYSENAIPSVNLFKTDKDNNDLWDPIRKRQFNYQILQLVGPEDEWDIPTQKAVEERSKITTNDYTVERYKGIKTDAEVQWLGYINPDLINDHVFPQGPLVIAQLGTMEEWSLRNWNWGGIDVRNGGYFTSHPFHIHVNDYQVKESDNELPRKRTLEDVTQLNSSGYNYIDKDGKRNKLKPLVGEFVPIDEELQATSYTTGYNDTTIRMLYQDFLGTFVHHCHLLEHEDAGMMQVVSVIENTDSSWLIPAENITTNSQGITLRQADTLGIVELKLNSARLNKLNRSNVGDITGDFVQDIILSLNGDENTAGSIYIYDGASLKNKQTKLLSRLTPYENSSLSPWSFHSDFTGDGRKNLVTAGFTNSPNKKDLVKLSDLQVIGWKSSDSLKNWKESYRYSPWENVDDSASLLLNSQSTTFGVGDYNLDNFDDYATAYVHEGKLRLRILDGASVALINQTGKYEGGYLPDTDILSDIEYESGCFDNLKSLSISSGFNSYSQSAIENLIVTAKSNSGHDHLLTFQLNSGHFITTGTMSEEDHTNDNEASEAHQHHSGHQMASASLDGVTKIGGSFNLSLTNHQSIKSESNSVTPTFAGALGDGALLVDDKLVISQGTSDGQYSIGNEWSSDTLYNNKQDLYLNLKGVDTVEADDLTGISNKNTKYNAKNVDKRINLTMLAFQAYTNTMIKPSDLAKLSIANANNKLNPKRLVRKILKEYSSQVKDFYGQDLKDMSAEEITDKTFKTLYNRSPNTNELREWSLRDKNGLNKKDLPMEILRNTDGQDKYRVALLSAASKWSQSQWGTNAIVDGNFGQGLISEISTFEKLSSLIIDSKGVQTWESANTSFDQYQDDVMDSLNGTPVSKTGFF